MESYLNRLLKIAIGLSLMFAAGATAGNVMKSKTVDGMRIELHLLPAEPFFTADEAALKHVSEGMLIMSGAAPVPPDAEPRPTHHLVAHVFNTKTGKAITDAAVDMNFQLLDNKGKPSGAAVNVPVVAMQAIGKGAQSTHYGNNVTMASGSYAVTVMVNGKKAEFKVTVTQNGNNAMHGMHMH
jgi:hypothetical protein